MRSQIVGLLDSLSHSEMVTSVLDRARRGVQNDEPLQTGRVLAAVFDLYSTGKWARIWSSVWPSYDGTADALLAAATDTRSYASAQSWRGIRMSQDLLVALLLLARIAKAYKMDPIPPGAMLLALASDPGTGAARYLCELNGSTHAELLDRVQSDLLGARLEGFENLAALAGTQLDRQHRLTRLAGALCCWWVAELAISAGVGWAMGAILTIGTAVSAFFYTRLLPLSELSRQKRPGRVRIWRIPNFKDPLLIVALLIVIFFAANAIVKRHAVPILFIPNLVLSVCAILIILIVGGLTFASKTPRIPAWPFLPGFSYQMILGTTATLAGITALLAWYARQAMLAIPQIPYGAHITWRGRTILWMQNHLTEAYFGASFSRSYWPLLVAVSGAVAGYFCGLASQILLTRITSSSIRWIAMGYVGGAVIAALSYLPLSVRPALYVNTIFTPGALYKYPSGPESIGLNNHDYIAGIHWLGGKDGTLTGMGALYHDNCNPSCAGGTYVTYQVQILAMDPRRCVVPVYPQGANNSLAVKAVIYDIIEIKALKRGAPPYETGFSVLSVPCELRNRTCRCRSLKCEMPSGVSVRPELGHPSLNDSGVGRG
jgi:hypothetical protein